MLKYINATQVYLSNSDLKLGYSCIPFNLSLSFSCNLMLSSS